MVAQINLTEVDGYDPSTLISLFVRARRVVRAHHGDGRLSTTAEALCDFYRELLADATFWRIATRVSEDPPLQILDILASIGEFEAVEYDLLRAAGLEEDMAGEVVDSLSSALWRYSVNSGIDISQIRQGIDLMTRTMCDPRHKLDSADLRGRLWVRIASAFKAAAIIVGGAVDIVAPPPFNIASVSVCVFELAETSARMLGERD